jgi:hypothetical protein
MNKWIAAAIAFSAAGSLSALLTTYLTSDNRSKEWNANLESGELTPSQLHWTLVHIRDDIGPIVGLLVLTNSLLAAILAVMLI